MDRKILHQVVFIIICLALIRGLLYGLIIPINQTPDELHHFKLIKASQLKLEQAGIQEKSETAARIGLAMYYVRYPETQQQRSIADFQKETLPQPFSSLNIYYTFAGWFLHVLELENIRDEMYAVRGLSILLGTVVIGLSFLLAHELFVQTPFLLIGVPLLITFVPQFSAMNGSINNDKFAEIFSALVLLYMVRMLKHGITGVSLALFLGTVGLAILGKRTSLFLLPLTVLFFLVYYWKGTLGFKMHLVLILMSLGLVIGGFFLLRYVHAGGALAQYVIEIPAYKIRELLFRSAIFSPEALKHYAKYFIVLYWSFWGVFGYMTIHLHHLWYTVVAVVQVIALGGLGYFIWKVKRRQWSVEQWKAKSLYLYALSIVFAVIIAFFRSNILRFEFSLTQGRYLFPVIIPISLLTVFGLSVVIPPKHYRMIGLLGLLGLLIFDSVCLLNYILLNFYSISVL